MICSRNLRLEDAIFTNLMVENKEISHWYNFCLFSHY